MILLHITLHHIIGMLTTLTSRLVKAFEFEYHDIGYWATADFKIFIDILDILHCDCYWELNNYNVIRLTGTYLLYVTLR